MTYSDFRFRAVVDWIEVEIQTEKTTNFQTVQRAFNEALFLPKGLNIWTKSHDANEGGGTNLFSLRIHDVMRHSDIEQLLIKVGAKLGLKPGFRVNKIELALDAYSDDPADQAARFYKFMANPVSNNRRVYHEGRGTPKAVPRHFESIARHLSEGWQIAIGNKTDERYQHIYVKDTDTHDGQRQQVRERARLEIRLAGSALPCQTSEEWRQCKFEKLADHFRQRELKADLDPLMGVLAEAVDQIGERKTRNRREGGTRKYSKATKAAPINEAIRNALKKLSERWKGSGKRGRPTNTKTKLACGNSVGIKERNLHEHREDEPHSNNYIYKQEQPVEVTATDFPLGAQDTTGRSFDRSIESAGPIHSDQTNKAIEEVIAIYEATPEAKNEHGRIDRLMETPVAPPPAPLNIEVLEKTTSALG